MKTIHEARPHIDAALQYSGGTHTFDDVVKGVEADVMQFWPGPNSAIITEIQEYPRKRILHFFLAGGNLAELERMLPVIEAWGRENGCTAATLAGRLGWQRTFLVNEGWKTKLVVMSKDLE